MSTTQDPVTSETPDPQAELDAARARIEALEDAALALVFECKREANRVNWNVPEAWALALQGMIDVLKNSPVDHVAGYKAVFPEPRS